MGLLDRLGDIGEGFVDIATAPAGFAWDLARAPFVEDEFDGILETLAGVTYNRAGQLLGGVGITGGEGLWGTAVRALPPEFRQAVMFPVRGTLDTLETAYREGIAEPIATAITVGSLSDRPGGGGLGGFLDANNWRDAYRIAQHRSPGQALALALGTRDVLNEAEVADAVNTPFYRVASGVADAATRWFADPLALVGRGAQATRALRGSAVSARQAPVIRSQREIGSFFGGNRFRTRAMRRWIDDLDRIGGNSSQIRLTYFPDHPDGDAIANVLGQAVDRPMREDMVRALMGDRGALDLVQRQRADLAGQINRLLGEDQAIQLALFGEPGAVLRAAPARKARTDAELDALYDQAEVLRRRDEIMGTLRAVPTVAPARTRAAVVRSDFYQKSFWAKPLRTVFDMRPNMIELHSNTGSNQVWRLLQQADKRARGLARSRQVVTTATGRAAEPARAGFALDEMEELRAAYMAAPTPSDRLAVVRDVESRVVRRMGEAAGVEPGEMDRLVNGARGLRTRLDDQIAKSRAYDAQGRGRIEFEDDHGTVHRLFLPLHVTQLDDVFIPLDLDEVAKAIAPIGRHLRRYPGRGIPTELAERFYRLWRPAVLLRLGWPLRVVGDEQARIISEIGVMALLRDHARGFRTFAADIRDQVPKAHRKPSNRQFSIGPYEMQGAFGMPNERANAFLHAVSSRGAWEAMVDRNQGGKLRSLLRRPTGESRSVAPVEPEYASAWERAVNQQIAQNPMARKFLEGSSVDDVVSWLRADPQGQSIAREMRMWRGRHRQWAQDVHDQVQDYLLGDRGLMAKALQRRVTHDDLVALQPNATHRPVVHGELLAEAMGQSTTVRTLSRVTDTLYRWLGSLPTDVASRHRYFDDLYQREVERLVNLYDEGGSGWLAPEQLRRIEQQARRYALGENRRLLYNLAEKSDLAAMTQFLSPFFMAYSEVLSVWSHQALRNPAFVSRARTVWRAPEAVGLVVDERGYRVHPDGTATDFSGRRVKAGEDRLLVLPLPSFVKDIPGLSLIGGAALEGRQRVLVNKETFSIAQGIGPGFGPLAQIPFAALARDRPDIAESLEFMFPYGVPASTRDLVLPAFARALTKQVENEENRVFRNTRMRLYYDKLVDYNLGKRDDPPSWEEATTQARDFWKFSAFAKYASPVGLDFQSPYEPYRQAYRDAAERLRQDPGALRDPETGQARTADEWFLDTYGEEFFPLTQSLSRSVTGIPPTVEGYEGYERYRALVEKYPRLGGLITGSEGAGEFSSAVYQFQLRTPVRPGSAERQREPFAFEEGAGEPLRRLGWLRYRKVADAVDAALFQMGLSNLNSRAAAGLKAWRDAQIEGIRQATVDPITERSPWYDDFVTPPSEAEKAKFLQGLREVAGDDRLARRPEIAALGDYLRLRDTVVAVLGQSEARSLEAEANAGLRLWFGQRVAELVEQNLAFADTYHRYLENDRITAHDAELV